MAVVFEVDFAPGWTPEAFAAMSAAGEDMTPLMDQIGALLEQSARDRIEVSNEAPDGTPWMPSDRVDQQGGKTLFDSGRLAASLGHQAYPDMAEIGSNLIYAGVHQAGAIITAKNGGALTFTLPDGQFVEVASVEIPARPYLGVSETDEADMQALAASFFGRFLEGAAP